MSSAEGREFIRLVNGTSLLRRPDGGFDPVRSETDYGRLAAMTDDEIEYQSANDPDHPHLDERFWAGVGDTNARVASTQTPMLAIDEDVLRYFQRSGEDYEARINAVLKHYVEATKERL